MSGPRFQVNLNGTSAEALRERHLTVLHLAQALDAALVDAMPHGRDYQTLPGGHEVCLQDQATVSIMRRHVQAIEEWARAGTYHASRDASHHRRLRP